MKRYFIENIRTATELNKSYSGTIMRYVYGKQEKLMAREAVADPKCYARHLQLFNDLKNPVLVKEFGFTFKGRAEAAIRKLEKENTPIGAWKVEFRVIEVEVE